LDGPWNGNNHSPSGYLIIGRKNKVLMKESTFISNRKGQLLTKILSLKSSYFEFIPFFFLIFPKNSSLEGSGKQQLRLLPKAAVMALLGKLGVRPTKRNGS